MGKPSAKINNRFLNEYIFDILSNLTKDQKQYLTRRQLRATYNAKYAKAFATTATLEEKVELLAKVGVHFWCGFGSMNNKVITDLYKKHKAEGGNASIKEMQDLGIFVFSDREIAQFMGLLSGNCHTETYMLNREFLQTGFKVKRWKQGRSTTNDEINEATEANLEISKIMYHGALLNEYVQDAFGVNQCQMLLLLYLFRYKNKFIDTEEIKAQLTTTYTPTKVTTALRFLKDNDYIARDASREAVKWQIATLGINTVMRYNKKLLNLVNNF